MTAQTHSEAASVAQVRCEACGTDFTPRRAWSRFCNDRCRNAFHQAEARVEAIKAAGVPMYEALRVLREIIRGKDVEQVWLNHPIEPADTPGKMIDRLLAKLKPPATPKQLLEERAKQ